MSGTGRTDLLYVRDGFSPEAAHLAFCEDAAYVRPSGWMRSGPPAPHGAQAMSQTTP
jgi:hypothetical protein